MRRPFRIGPGERWENPSVKLTADWHFVVRNPQYGLYQQWSARRLMVSRPFKSDVNKGMMPSSDRFLGP